MTVPFFVSGQVFDRVPHRVAQIQLLSLAPVEFVRFDGVPQTMKLGIRE